MKKKKSPVMVADLVKDSSVGKKKKKAAGKTSPSPADTSAYSFVSQSYTGPEAKGHSKAKGEKQHVARERAHLMLSSLKEWRQVMINLVDRPAALMLNREPAVFLLNQFAIRYNGVIRRATRTRNALGLGKQKLIRKASQVLESSVADRLRAGLTSLLHVRGPFRRAEV